MTNTSSATVNICFVPYPSSGHPAAGDRGNAGHRRERDVDDRPVDDRHEQPGDVGHHHAVLVLRFAEPQRKVGILSG